MRIKHLLNIFLYVNCRHFSKNITKYLKDLTEQVAQDGLYRKLKRRAERPLTPAGWHCFRDPVWNLWAVYRKSTLSSYSCSVRSLNLAQPQSTFINKAASRDTGSSSGLLFFFCLAQLLCPWVSWASWPQVETRWDAFLEGGAYCLLPPSPAPWASDSFSYSHFNGRDGVLPGVWGRRFYILLMLR